MHDDQLAVDVLKAWQQAARGGWRAMSRICSRVSRVAMWTGWCSPCGSEDRPLVLTRSGPGGLASWLSGLSDDDRLLLLTCRICGQWQSVPAREEDDPEVALVVPAPRRPRTLTAVPSPAPSRGFGLPTGTRQLVLAAAS